MVLFLRGITKVPAMEITSVTSKGQVTIPKPLRQQLGLRQGSKVEFVLVGDHVEMRVVSTPADLPASGFGMLKSKRRAVSVDFDPAGLLGKDKTGRSR
jgi:AbrB family looped-hinge helix DNA binding protein